MCEGKNKRKTRHLGAYTIAERFSFKWSVNDKNSFIAVVDYYQRQRLMCSRYTANVENNRKTQHTHKRFQIGPRDYSTADNLSSSWLFIYNVWKLLQIDIKIMQEVVTH